MITIYIINIREKYTDGKRIPIDITYDICATTDFKTAKESLKKIKEKFLSDERKFKDVFTENDITIDAECSFFAVTSKNLLDIHIDTVTSIDEVVSDGRIEKFIETFNHKVGLYD